MFTGRSNGLTLLITLYDDTEHSVFHPSLARATHFCGFSPASCLQLIRTLSFLGLEHQDMRGRLLPAISKVFTEGQSWLTRTPLSSFRQ